MRNLTAEIAATAEKNMAKNDYPSLPYIVPFALFLLFLAAKDYIPFEYPLRVLVVATAAILFSRKAISLRAPHALASVLLGVLVFGIWIGPDILWPAYRQHWLFHNSLIGRAQSSLPGNLRTDAVFLFFRISGTALLVPVIEELFWRGWLMRYLISADFQKVRLGAYAPFSFWLTALLFASEHGPYWEVGFLAGIAFNWWMMRTRSLGDCILAHAVTNGCLAAYVIAAGQWQYWL